MITGMAVQHCCPPRSRSVILYPIHADSVMLLSAHLLQEVELLLLSSARKDSESDANTNFSFFLVHFFHDIAIIFD